MKTVTKVGLVILAFDAVILAVDVFLISTNSPAAPHFETMRNLIIATAFLSFVTWATK